MKVEWKKVNPAELSVTCCADYFAFSDQGYSLFVGEIDQKCTFTTIIQASVKFNLSIYQMDIWVGFELDPTKQVAGLEEQFSSFLKNRTIPPIVNEPLLIWEISA